jgi:hypothetical protein
MTSVIPDPADPTAEALHLDAHGTADATLGGYLRVHERPPAFQGEDGHPYTVSIETERTPDLRNPVAGYLVFPRWAETGVGIVGHVESPLLWQGGTVEEVEGMAKDTPLEVVRSHLDDAIRRRGAAPAPDLPPQP